MKHLVKCIALLLAIVMLCSACATDPTPGSSDSDVPETKTAPVTEPADPVPTDPQKTEPDATDDTAETGVNTEPSDTTEEPGPAEPVDLGGYAVSSSTKEATAAGMQILKDGGNAIDAAVAVALALGVTEPYSSGLGGSGVMVVYDPATDKAYSLDYYACAGAALENTDFVGVPGYLAGMQEALDRWGTMSLAEVIEPAITLAEKGFKATPLFARRLTYSARVARNPAFVGVKSGSTVIQTELAETLKLIRDEGISAFYNGKIAADIAKACNLTTVDLASYHVYCYDALQSEFNGYRIFTTYAPTSGVVTSQMLTVADLLDVPDADKDPNGYLEVMKIATQVAYQTRRNKLVDPRFYDFNGKKLVSSSYVQKRIDKLTEAGVSAPLGEDPERRCTTQFAVIDKNGMIVSVTNTLSDNWGCYTYVDGFYLNNTLSNFNQTGKNAYEPLKRPRTHFSPLIAVGSNHSCLAIGSPGGDNIPKIVSQVLIEVLKQGTDLQKAVDQARYFYDSDMLLCLETSTSAGSLLKQSKIKERYYFSSSHVTFGCTAVVGYDPAKGIIAACDTRRDGSDCKIEKTN